MTALSRLIRLVLLTFTFMVTLYNGDCLEESSKIQSGSVDLILTDLPYGTMDTDGGRKLNINGWDKIIPAAKIMEIANRILRKNGKMVLFAQQPFTTELINDAIPNLPFCYNMIWEKDSFANALGAKKAPVNYYEDVLVFSKNHDLEALHPLRPYFSKVLDYIGLKLKSINKKLGHRKAEHTFYINSSQFELCTKETYQEIIEAFNIDKMQGFRDFHDLEQVNNAFNQTFNATFNLWQGKKHKSNIFKYPKDYDGHHPTQKPVLLLEDLIKTFSNENNLVVDLTMGSGSTGVACLNTNRNFIGIEKEHKYFKIAKVRTSVTQLNLF